MISPIANAKAYSQIRKENPLLQSFLIVRHPFHRLVSAFRDKLERARTKNPTHDFYFKSYGKTITNRYRQMALKVGQAREKTYGFLRDQCLPEWWRGKGLVFLVTEIWWWHLLKEEPLWGCFAGLRRLSVSWTAHFLGVCPIRDRHTSWGTGQVRISCKRFI